jgi:predicted ATPase/class 3 adenylate cyclase
VTFLFTDLEGSTRLWEEHPDAMKGALARHDEILRSAVEAHAGAVVKTTGDGLHAAFTTADHALGAAVAAQVALVAEAWDLPAPLRVRMGVHTGAAEERDGDYYGPAVNRAARVSAAAHGGQILVSHVAEELTRATLPTDTTLLDLGEHRLRDLARAERVFQLTAPGLATDFPPPRSVDAYPGNLPVQLSSFIGRERDVTAIAQALREARLVTLTGVGKTRLATQVAAELLPYFADGAWLCELAPASDGESMDQIVVAALGVTPRPGMTLQGSVVEFLAGKDLLVVLDNCEHLIDQAGVLAEAVLRECPKVRILATSREGLGVEGERLRVVRSLAIELAAARTAAMAPTEIARRLDERFRLLTGGRRTAVERHHTLRATVDWSYSLLAERERTVFDRLGAFSGSFDTTAAEAVAGGDDLEPWDVLDALTELVHKSMVVREPRTDTTRYTMLETLRQYARERLDEGAEADDVRRRHAQHYVVVAAELETALRGPEELAARARLADDLDNVRAAVMWALDRDDVGDRILALETIANLAWETNLDRTLGVGTWATRAIEAAEESPPPVRSAVLAAAAEDLRGSGDFDAALGLVETAVRDGVTLDGAGPALAMLAWSSIVGTRGSPDAALERLLEVKTAMEAAGTRTYEVGVLANIAGVWAGFAGSFEVAEALAREALAAGRRLGSPALLAGALFALGNAIELHDPDEALRCYEESIEITRTGASHAAYAAALGFAATLWHRTGRSDMGLQRAIDCVEFAAANRDVSQRQHGLSVQTMLTPPEVSAP